MVSPSAELVRELVGAIPDPEIPVLTLEDLGILRGVDLHDDGHLVVRITPTYSGCPALAPIRQDVESTVQGAGYTNAEVRIEMSPAWTTDWITAEGRRKLREYGISPPEPSATAACELARLQPPACPRCGSCDTREISRFGATPCQAQHVCNSCLEPFDRFKTLR
jgi:ring-1,2-phenylacetyl-CoA epoxidase subunit PaaD